MKNRAAVFQRRHYRVPFDCPVEFQILQYRRRNINHLSSKRGPACGHDLGEDGLSFISDYLLPVDMIIRVTFQLPDCGEQTVLARVVRSVPAGTGYLTAIQFLNFDGPRKDRLRLYITRETRKNYKFLKYL